MTFAIPMLSTNFRKYNFINYYNGRAKFIQFIL